MTLPGEFKQAIIQYTTDWNTVITVSQKRELALLVGNPIVELRDTAQGIPERGRLRKITIATISGGEYFTREIVIAKVTNALWTGALNSLVIDGVLWRVIERRGEYRRGPYAT